jgi:hypothetical protein
MRRLLLLAFLLAPVLAHAGEPYLETFATSGITLAQRGVENNTPLWDDSKYVGVKLIGRLPLPKGFALVGRGYVQGMPGVFVAADAQTFNAMVADLGVQWVPLRRWNVAGGLVATAGHYWAFHHDVKMDDESLDTFTLGVIVRHEATRAWVLLGAVKNPAYGRGWHPGAALHTPVFQNRWSIGLEAVLGRSTVGGVRYFPSIKSEVQVGWSWGGEE